jgi:type 1 glutamine amidotransferase/HEAT repeat protein
MTFRRCLFAICFCLLLPIPLQAGNQQIRALILSGKNNHDWQATTPALKVVLEASGFFKVNVIDDPSVCNETMLKDYDVIVSNWTNFPAHDRVWGPRAENAIMEFIRSGKGFALFHAASACFPAWPEYQQLIGATWGEKTGHGPYHSFNVSVTDTAHPITRVVGDFVTTDELWHRMDKQQGVHILCLAYSDTAGGGTGQWEPVAYTTQFGQGRGFYLVLGHDVPAMLNPNWKLLLLRGTEWAATGFATIEIPFDIPRTLHDATVSTGTAGQEQMATVQQLVQSSSRNPSLRRSLASTMAEMLGTAIPEIWKSFFCEQLSLIGTAADVPALAQLLADSSLGFHARFALERIPDPASVNALRHAASTTNGAPLVGLVNALGEKKDTQSADFLALRFGEADESKLKGAAIHALGKIGGPEAVRLLQGLSDTSRDLRLLRDESLLRCANAYVTAGRIPEATPIYELLNVPHEAPHVRIAGFAGVIRCHPEQGRALVLDALKSRDPVLQAGVIRVLREPGADKLAPIVAAHSALIPPTHRAQVFYALADIGESSILPDLYGALTQKDPSLRIAALYGIGKLGDSSSVNRISALLNRADIQERAEAREALVSLRGTGVDERLLTLLSGASSTVVKQEVIAVLAARDCRSAVPTLLDMAKVSNTDERKAAIKALGSLADPAISTTIVQVLKSDTFVAGRSSMVKALITLGERDASPDRVCNVLLAELPTSSPPVKESMFQVLSRFGGDKSYQAIKASLGDPDLAVQAAAVRALSAWPDASPIDDLFALAHAPGSASVRLLAMRGGIALLEKSSDLTDNERVRILERELQRSESSDVKRLLLSQLGRQTSMQALHLAVSCLDQPDVADEAALAVAGIARSTAKEHAPETRAALKKALEACQSPSVKEQVRSLLLAMESDKKGNHQ